MLISQPSFENLTPEDVTVIILSALGHDLGMHITFKGFKCLIEDRFKLNKGNDYLNDRKWSDLWNEYLKEIKIWSDKKKQQVFGRVIEFIDIPEDELDLTKLHRLIIGEFLRKNHHRLAYDIILQGFPLDKTEFQDFIVDTIPYFKLIIAIVARSHGEDLWSMVDHLHRLFGRVGITDKIYKVHVCYLMSILRLSDYLDLSEQRAGLNIYQKHNFHSSISKLEWEFNQSVYTIDFGETQPDTVYIWVNPPKRSIIFLKLEAHIKAMQSELDSCWAALGYVHSKMTLSVRRINSNLKDLINELDYVPEKISFDANKDLIKLLIKPLYGEDIKYAIRELLQNAIDACHEKASICNEEYEPQIEIVITNGEFIITDNGIGMGTHIITNYFLVAGASYRNDFEWKKVYIDKGTSKVIRGGRFGIGVLASFLIGNQLTVKTRPYFEKYTYSFDANLDVEQIDIFKNTYMSTSGTEIRIKITESIPMNLFKNLYVFDKPKIWVKNHVSTQIANMNVHVSKDTMYYFKEHSIEVYWSYCNEYRISYNGFILEEEKSFNCVSLNIFNIQLHFLDWNNSLNLELNRKVLINSKHMVNIWMMEVCKTIVAPLLFKRYEFKELLNNLYRPWMITTGVLYEDFCFLLNHEGYLPFHFYNNADLYNKHLIVINGNIEEDLAKEIININNDIVLIVGDLINEFTDRKQNNMYFNCIRAIINIENGSYSDIKHATKIKYNNLDHLNRSNYFDIKIINTDKTLKSMVLLKKNRDSKEYSFLSKEIIEKLIQSNCEVGEYIVMRHSAPFPKYYGILYNSMFRKYILYAFKAGAIPYDCKTKEIKYSGILKELKPYDKSKPTKII